jgi:hypothetical protein
MTCKCGHQFCYVCGEDWSALHYMTHDEHGRPIPLRESEPQRDCSFADCCCTSLNVIFRLLALIAFAPVILFMVAVLIIVILLLLIPLLLAYCCGCKEINDLVQYIRHPLMCMRRDDTHTRTRPCAPT